MNSRNLFAAFSVMLAAAFTPQQSSAAVSAFWSAGAWCGGSNSANFSPGGAPVTMSLCATTTAPDGICGVTIVPLAANAGQSGHFNIANRTLNTTLLPDATTGASPVTYPVPITGTGAIIPPTGTLDWGGTVNTAPPPSPAAGQLLATFSIAPTASATNGSYAFGVNAASVVTTSGTDCLNASTDTLITASFTFNLVTAELSFAQAAYTVTEGGAAISVGVARSGPLTSATSVTWTTANGTAVAGSDFGTAGNASPRTGTLSWAAGDGATKNITVGLAASNVPVINDTVVEAAKAFTIGLSSPTNGVSIGATSSTTVTIIDNDSVIGFAVSAITVSEAGPNVTLQVTRTGSTALAQAVTWRTANGTALLGQDFGALAATVQPTGTINFAIGEAGPKSITIGPASARAPFISIINDTAIEGPETLTVNLSAPTNGAVLGTSSATITINSDERAISMAAATRSLGESAGAQSILVSRLGAATGAISVAYAFTNGSALNGTHFSGSPGTLSWADSDDSQKSIPVTIIDNATVNPARTFTVTLSAPSGAVLATPMSTLVTISDDDNTVQFTASTAAITEGTATLTLTLARTGATAGPATVTYATVDGSALAGTDFGIAGNGTPTTGTVTWLAGAGGSKTITIPILNDAVVEGPKTFTVTLSNPVGSNLAIGPTNQVAVALNDDDAGVRFSAASYEVTEGPAGVILTVQRIGPLATAASATWATVNGSAISGQDFGVTTSAAPRTGTLSWLVGDGAPKSFTIPILNDTLGGEGDETFTVTLTPGAGLVLGTPGIATVTIHDNDLPPESNLAFAQAKYVVAENAANVTLTLQRADIGGGVGRIATVNYATQPGSALAPSDYTTKSGTVTWAAGDVADKTITVAIVNNTVAEPNESFRVVLSNPTSGTGFGALSEATVMIIDDDEVFPPAGNVPAGWSKPAAATAGWHVFNDPAPFEGAFTLHTDAISHGESAEIEATGTFAAGNITFRVKVSSEAGFDMLRFTVDGQPAGLWSGTSVTTWQTITVPISAGTHTVRWSYQKDGDLSAGQDAAFLDGVVLPGFTP
ncbi:MAG: Calx-beta domain-containing protein [Usitatibacter sp.]